MIHMYLYMTVILFLDNSLFICYFNDTKRLLLINNFYLFQRNLILIEINYGSMSKDTFLHFCIHCIYNSICKSIQFSFFAVLQCGNNGHLCIQYAHLLHFFI